MSVAERYARDMEAARAEEEALRAEIDSAHVAALAAATQSQRLAGETLRAAQAEAALAEVQAELGRARKALAASGDQVELRRVLDGGADGSGEGGAGGAPRADGRAPAGQEGAERWLAGIGRMVCGTGAPPSAARPRGISPCTAFPRGQLSSMACRLGGRAGGGRGEGGLHAISRSPVASRKSQRRRRRVCAPKASASLRP
jgi:hypothetical protein